MSPSQNPQLFQKWKRAISDVVFFAEHFFLADDNGPKKLLLWQKKELKNWKKNRMNNSIHARQNGGSLIERIWITHRALTIPDRQSLMLVPEYMQKPIYQILIDDLKRISAKIAPILDGMEPFRVLLRGHDGGVSKIELVNGSRIIALSYNGATTERLRGMQFHTLIIDNPDYVAPTLRREIMHTIFPVISVLKNSQIIMCGTPKPQDSFQMDLIKNDQWSSNVYNWTHVPWWTGERYREMVRSITPESWESEFQLDRCQKSIKTP